MIPDMELLWSWLKAENRHDSLTKPARGTPVPNRAEMRRRRLNHGGDKPGSSRRQRISNAQHRADVREHDRKWRQAKRRQRRADAGAVNVPEIEYSSIADTVKAQSAMAALAGGQR